MVREEEYPEPSITVQQQTFAASKAQTLEVAVTVSGVARVVTQEVINDVLIVSAAAGADEATLSAQLQTKGYTIVGKNSDIKIYQVALPSGKTLSEAIADMSSLSAVKSAGTDPVAKKELTIPDDTAFKTASKSWAFDQLGMKKVWDLTTGSSTVRVAVVDSGIDLDHPEFENRFIYKKNFAANNDNPNDDEIDSHGTGVAGIALAKGNNSKFMAGMNWNCKIIPLKVLDNQGSGDPYAACNAICYAAAAGAKIINYSGGNWYNGWTNSSIIEHWQETAKKCADYGALLIVSAGNDNSNVEGNTSTHYPGGGLKDYANVITVAAVNQNGNLSTGTNYGSAVTIAAPGEDITTVINETSPGEPMIAHTGTSFAAPFVTGLASLIWSINPSLTASGVKSCIVEGSDAISTGEVGYKINAWKAVLKALEFKTRGVIAVQATPDGANIFIDDEDKGRVTTSEGYVYFEATTGSHTVKVTKSGYTASQEAVTVTKGTVTYSDLTLGGAGISSMISGDTSTYLKIDNGNFWIRTDYTSSSARNILNQIGLSSTSTNWLNRSIYPSPCLTQNSSSFFDGVKDRSLTILKDTSTLAAYQSQFTITSGSEDLRVTWKFVVPKDKKYAIWVASFESIGTDKSITVDNATGEAIQDVYFFYPLQPTAESDSSRYISYEAYGSAIPWSYASDANYEYNGSTSRYFSVYTSTGCLTFGFLTPYSTNPYQMYFNNFMGYKSVCATVKKVTLSVSSPRAQWVGVLAFHSGVSEAASLFRDAQNNLDTYLSILQ